MSKDLSNPAMPMACADDERLPDTAWWALAPCALALTTVAGRVLDLNPGLCALTGQARAQLIGQPMDRWLSPAARSTLQTQALPCLLREGQLPPLPLQVQGPLGQEVTVLASAQAGQFEGEIAHCWCLLATDMADTTARHRAPQAHATDRANPADTAEPADQTDQTQPALADPHSLLRVALGVVADAVITTDAQGHTTWLNPAAAQLTGWDAAQAQGLPVSQVFHTLHGPSRARASDQVLACLQTGQARGLSAQTLLVARTGEEHHIEGTVAPVPGARGQGLGSVLVFHDVSAQRRLRREMRHRASHDALTGLVNREAFEQRLGRAFEQAVDTGVCHALLLIDLDRFKLVNDACGHAAGDLLLQQVAHLLGEGLRQRDTLARLGGDEFAILMEHCSPEQALRAGQAICARMDRFRFVHQDHRFHLGASMGLAPVDARWCDPSSLQQAADDACCQAKQAGGNRVQAWHEGDAALAARHQDTAWAARLQDALDHGGFELHAQRQQNLSNAEPGLRAELQLRLRQPDGSLVQPTAFMPAAERFHLAVRIDRWVLDQAVQWMRSLPTLAPLACLSVNLSAQSVADRAFHGWLGELLGQAGPAVCARLCLEITETVAVTQLADAALFIAQVHQAGATVALDDFGAGAASFSHLRALQVDTIKIDGQFVADLLADPLADAAVRCFVDVSRLLGLQVVAEHVEQAAVLARLRQLGVHRAQGFLDHRPEPLHRLLARHLA